ncbi:PucR family transcriptional regulator [Halobacillus campisalis]|uniref:PucR family transcriptional regulator n=1 Tax=Halobacillus campisalis TaxID=435909 RepID=A0ABW2K6Z5_9BACI|nr:PucR family transcriptional regulator [Halobacillus campisalis]
MKVSEVLHMPALEGCHVIAGETGIDREILHVNMMDAPDIARFLKPQELLVTTAYHVKDQPELLLELVEAMNAQGCAALGIKTKRFLQKIPVEVIKLADELGFPIIELPSSTSLGDIVNQTLSNILDKKTNELRLAIDTHKQFSQHIMSGKGLHKLLKSLADMLHVPVALLDQYANPIAASDPKLTLNHLAKGIYVKGGNTVPEASRYYSFSTVPDRRTYSVFPVFTHEKRAGSLIVFSPIHKEDHSSQLTIEQAANVISFELIKENALKQYSRRVKNEFFLNFTEGMFSSQEEIINRAKEFSLENNAPYFCAIGKVVTKGFSSYTQTQIETDQIYEHIEEELIKFSLSTYLFTRGDQCILLFKVDGSAKENHDYVVSSLKLIQDNVKDRFGRCISFGISNLSRNLLNVRKGYKEAQDALQTGLRTGEEGFIQSYRTKDVMELLRVVPEEDLKEFYDNALNRLAGEDETLLDTLFVHLETHSQISETAKRLFVHRNTVVYRLEKCEELLGGKLSDAETTMQIRLALRIKTMLGF